MGRGKNESSREAPKRTTQNAVESHIAACADVVASVVRFTTWIALLGAYRALLRKPDDPKLTAMVVPFRIAFVCELVVGTEAVSFQSIPGAFLALLAAASIAAMLVAMARAI